MKKLFFTIAVLIITCCTTCFAEENITVKINNVSISFDVAPRTVNGRTMVPVRAIFEALDASVHWDEATNGITAIKGDTKITMHLNDTVMTINDKTVVLETPPFETGGRTLVPVRAISEAFQCKVLWEEITQTVYIETTSYDAQEIAKKASPAVFYIEVYDVDLNPRGLGSGFFIDSKGIAVTNHHVISGADIAIIKMTDGTVLAIDKILYANKAKDFAIFTVMDETPEDGLNREFPYLELGDSDKIVAGETIYAIGNPLGLENTISDGIVSNTYRILGESEYIQMSVPISGGNSGGAVINNKCQVIGIASAGMADGQNLNFAVPINLVKNTVYYSRPLNLWELPKDYLYLIPSEQFLTLAPGETKVITVTVDTNTDEWSPGIENYYPEIASVEAGEFIDENTFTVYVTGKRHGTGGGIIYTNGISDYVLFSVDVRASHIQTYGNANVATYTYITNRKCIASYDIETERQKDGFNPAYDYFFYDYYDNEFNVYCDYLESAGYERDDMIIYNSSREYYYSGMNSIVQIVVYPEQHLMAIFAY